MDHPASIFDRIFVRHYPRWLKILISLLILSLPFGFAAMDGVLDDLQIEDHWRVFLISPVMIIYIWWVSPTLSRLGNDVVHSLRKLIQLDDDSFSELYNRVTYINPRHELLIVGIGFALGVFSAGASEFIEIGFWLKLYWFISSACSTGLLAWVIFTSFFSTRIYTALHQQPIHFDILDPTTFVAVGRQSLILALVFIGGITISLLFTFQMQSLSTPGYWFQYIILVLITLSIFFISMRPTHRLLANEKQRELKFVQQKITTACRELVVRMDSDLNNHSLASEINALAVYEQHLLAARTWPYNTSILRTLFFSVFIPLVTVVVRILPDLLSR